MDNLCKSSSERLSNICMYMGQKQLNEEHEVYQQNMPPRYEAVIIIYYAQSSIRNPQGNM